jgi:uncharacterized membrane protein
VLLLFFFFFFQKTTIKLIINYFLQESSPVFVCLMTVCLTSKKNIVNEEGKGFGQSRFLLSSSSSFGDDDDDYWCMNHQTVFVSSS